MQSCIELDVCSLQRLIEKGEVIGWIVEAEDLIVAVEARSKDFLGGVCCFLWFWLRDAIEVEVFIAGCEIPVCLW